MVIKYGILPMKTTFWETLSKGSTMVTFEKKIAVIHMNVHLGCKQEG